ncbi:MAG TPA: YceI family protein [Thermoleophilaceae bacterium]|nr:YceI family protein [Thermoleophilaceae bacterium]
MSATATLVPTGSYTVDPIHSRVEFAVKHLGIATVKGTFGGFEGSLDLGEDLASVRASGTVEVASIDTGEPNRDAHLRSPDFFDADNHPQIRFESKQVRPSGDGEFEIVGELTMRGVTREIALQAEITGIGEDAYGGERVGLEVRGQLNRGDWGLKWNQVLGSGNLVVSEKVKLELDISAVRQ